MSIFIHHGHACLEIRQTTQQEVDSHKMADLLETLKSSETATTILVGAAFPEELLKESSSGFLWLEAAGGLIENPSGEILLIYRRGAWDLPKGKIDPGETPESAAIREVEEETGLVRLTQVESLPPTYHIYPWNTAWVLKKTHWFRYRLQEDQPLTLQKEEDIEDATWIKVDELALYWNQIYPSLRPLIRSVMD